MNNFYTLIVILVIFILSYTVGDVLDNNEAADIIEISYNLNCDPGLNQCDTFYKTKRISVRFSNQPKLLEFFEVMVELNDMKAERVMVEFLMKGMDMAETRYDLTKMSVAGSWQKKTILSICTLNRNDWIVRVFIQQADQILVTNFKFKNI